MRKFLVLAVLTAFMCYGCDDSGSSSGFGEDDDLVCDGTGRCDRPGGGAQIGDGTGTGTGTGDGTGTGTGTGDGTGTGTGTGDGTGTGVSGNANGSKCSVNKDCKSRLCVNKVCRSDSESTIVSGNNGGSGSGSGGSGSGGNESSENGVGVSENWVGGGSVATGTSCSLDRECESGLCYEGKCSDNCEMVGCIHSNQVCRYGKCIPTSTDGGECTGENYTSKCKLGEYCCNGFCRSSACEPGIIADYGSGATCVSTSYHIRDYNVRICGCDKDDQCGMEMFCSTSGTYYYSYNNYIEICVTKMKYNANCSDDKECESNSCFGGHCSNPVDRDNPCESDNNCKSGTCGEAGRAADYCEPGWYDCYCEDKYDNGAGCRQDSNCVSGYCGIRSKKCEDDPRK